MDGIDTPSVIAARQHFAAHGINLEITICGDTDTPYGWRFFRDGVEYGVRGFRSADDAARHAVFVATMSDEQRRL